MGLNVFQYRSGLRRTLDALKKGKITLGFLGGSITDAQTGNRWPEYVIGWFAERYPDVRIYVENAAIGATGSDLGVFRAERDIISKNCDIVFVEYAVNDNGEEPEKRMRTREGLIRKLLREERDIILTYTFCQEMYPCMNEGKIPLSIGEFEELAEYYGISSVWMGLYALEEVKKGRMRWEEWLPDGIHTEYKGSLSYAQSVIAFLEEELILKINKTALAAGEKILPPLNLHNWEHTSSVPFSAMKLYGPWVVRRWERMAWVDQILDTAAVGAKLSFDFEGKGLCLGFDFGKTASEFRYRMDGGEWIDTNRERPWWLGDSGQYSLMLIADDLANTKHEFELEVTHGNRAECKGTNFRLALAGIIL